MPWMRPAHRESPNASGKFMSDAIIPHELPTGVTRFLVWVTRVAAACAELWRANAWLLGLASPAELVSMHLAIVGAFFGMVWLTHREAAAALLVDAAMLFLTGPLAAVGMIMRRRGRPVVLAVARTTTAPVSAAESLYSDIVAGRRPRRDPSNQLSILDRLSSSDLATQQFAVAAISRNYRPEMHAALMAALQSPTPAVRVQAAAVFAKLREHFTSEARRLLQSSASNAADVETLPRRSQTAAACRELARSPFLDDAVTRALMDKVRHLEAEPAPAVSEPAPGAPVAEPVLYDNRAIEMATVAGRKAIAVEAHTSAASRIARLFGSSSRGLEQVA